MKESQVEKNLVKKVKEKHGLCLKFLSPGFSGVPDRIVIFFPGRIYFIELKAPSKKPRKLQRFVIEKLKQLGCDVRVIDTIQKIDCFISEVFDSEIHTT